MATANAPYWKILAAANQPVESVLLLFLLSGQDCARTTTTKELAEKIYGTVEMEQEILAAAWKLGIAGHINMQSLKGSKGKVYISVSDELTSKSVWMKDCVPRGETRVASRIDVLEMQRELASPKDTKTTPPTPRFKRRIPAEELN